MKFWVFAHGDASSEDWLDDYKKRFDAWAEASVEGLIAWPMRILCDDGSTVASYPVDAASTGSSRHSRGHAIWRRSKNSRPC